MFFSPFGIAITSLGEEKANLSAFRTFVRFVLFGFCRFSLPLGVWKGVRFVIKAHLQPTNFTLGPDATLIQNNIKIRFA